MRKLLFLFILLSLPSLLRAEESVYNLSFSPDVSYQRIVYHIQTGWGTRYTPPIWSKGFELWSGFTLGISDRFQTMVDGGYNFYSHKYGFSTGAVYQWIKNNRKSVGFRLSLVRETEGVYTLQAAALTSFKVAKFWDLSANTFLEKSFASNRDPVDWHLTAGISRNLGVINLGLEYLGEDLEDMWEEEEAEGGANNFVGFLISLKTKNFGFSLTPGYSLGPRPSTRDSFTVLSKFWVVID